MVFDLHLHSLRNANIRTLWEDDVHPHYVIRRYAEFSASLIHLNVEYKDGQVGECEGPLFTLWFTCTRLAFILVANFCSLN